MRDGSILLWRYDFRERRFPYNVLGRLIMFWSGSPYIHAAIYFMGYTYEEDAGGVRVRLGARPCSTILEPLVPMTVDERARAHEWLVSTLGWPYNWAKLIALALVYPTRRLWRWLGWVPFERDVYGETCSSYVDLCWRAAGRDILPHDSEEYTTPGMLAQSPHFRRIVCDGQG